MQKNVTNKNKTLAFHSTYFFPAFLGMMMLLSTTSSAQGDLLLYPKRIVFENSKRSQVINLVNIGKDTARYIISIVQSRMNVNGNFETITTPDSGQNFADKYIRYFPRSVVMGPNESQTIKVQLTNNSGLQQGEYRSHIYFRAEPNKRPLGEEEVHKDSTAISVELVAIFGISIPIIIRVGESTTKVTAANASFDYKKDSLPEVKVSFNRTGNMSVYGDISVDHISPQGKITRVAMVMGMAIYTPNAIRNFTLLLARDAAVDYHRGRLRIIYATQADAKALKIAETQVELK